MPDQVVQPGEQQMRLVPHGAFHAAATGFEIFQSRTQRCQAADAFMRARGIIGRPVGGYGLPHCLRITVGTADEVDIVIATLSEFMSSGRARGQA